MSNAPRVLVVEDDDALREALCDTIRYGGYAAQSATNGAEALALLESSVVDVVISDVQMDVMDGHTLLREVRAQRPELPFVMMTAHGSIEKAVVAMRDGATDYLVKPFEAEVLLEVVSRLGASAVQPATGLVAQDPRITQLLEMARRVAATNATVLISGESGTGKEVFARYLHQHSDRAEHPFLALNCAAIPESMLESMLFGYEKGAYTGAHQSRAGKFEQANGGTLLLDEISEMDLGLQAKLLRVLQEREVERLGGNKVIDLDVRVLATTNRNLREEVSAGRFREDLYYRLNVFPLHIPPLRERPLDIPPLADALLQRHAAGRPLYFSAAAQQQLSCHTWPGNVRELENTVQRAAILAQGDEIGVADVFFETAHPGSTMSCAPTATVTAGSRVEGESDEGAALEGDLKAREKHLIVEALSEVNGSRKAAAERLGISPRTLRYKLARLKEQGVAIPSAG
tara:strand:- start:9187 stop:10563 length:1377 start_codon:yes stop_codon:yes gene_type:complete